MSGNVLSHFFKGLIPLSDLFIKYAARAGSVNLKTGGMEQLVCTTLYKYPNIKVSQHVVVMLEIVSVPRCHDINSETRNQNSAETKHWCSV